MMKMLKNDMSTSKIFMMSQRLLETLLRYFNSCVWALSTLASVSSTFSSMRVCGPAENKTVEGGDPPLYRPPEGGTPPYNFHTPSCRRHCKV